MEIRKISISEINIAAYNPRKDLSENDPEYKAIQNSLDTFGLVEPLVWNKCTKNLVGGHQRLKVLIKKGAKEVEASIVDLDLESERALNIALNRVQGAWDENKLALLLAEMSNITNFNVELTGFNRSEISEILDAHSAAMDEDNYDSAIDSIEEPITKRGDLIILGEHRLLCGDSSNPDDFKLLMCDEKADLLDCDFPYNVNYMGGDCPSQHTRPKNSRRWEKIYSDNMPQPEYEAWMRKVLTNIQSYLKPGGAIYIWQGHRQIPPTYQILLELGFHVSSLICWLKESAVISYADFAFRSEHALYGWLQGAAHYFAGKPGENNVWEIHREPTKTYQHPTTKPQLLGCKAVKFSSRRGEIVLDTFLGSGNLMLACESLGRRCYGLEISEKYCDVIVRRLIAFAPDKVSQEVRAKYGERMGK